MNTEDRPPCERTPRTCHAASCKYFSILHNACVWRDLQAITGRLSRDPGAAEERDEAEQASDLIAEQRRLWEIKQALGG